MKAQIFPVSMVILSLFALLPSCRKDKIPTIITLEVTNITGTTASSGGMVIDEGSGAIVEKGISWSEEINPDMEDKRTIEGGGAGTFSSNISGLEPATTYYVRAYATNKAGTGYGNEINFTTVAVVPLVTTAEITGLTSRTASSGGNITSDGGSQITARGVCWSANQFPTLSDSHTIDGNGIGSFTSNLGCLFDATRYYVRAYATNEAGTAYGDQQSFITENDPITFNPDKVYGLVTDIDGNCYKTVQIGEEVWMAENLKTSRYNDGTPIPQVTDNSEWESLLSSISNPPYITTGAFCWYNNDSATYDNVYGKLYNYGVVSTGKICPAGWHVPSWIDPLEKNMISGDCYLNNYLGGTLMETGSMHWINPYSECINNETGFTALPAGQRNKDGTFSDLGYTAYFWATATIGWGPLVINQKVPHSNSYCRSPTACGILPTIGHSIRCVKDN
jgi:uncharacterized protein (TIGR02145 family)